ncbi:MAG: PDC sensor domain-containing protein [Gammaproteobacteria bacterium]|nr:PDC sensor domain-containing protein [Gammaproteobacteria bacterium]
MKPTLKESILQQRLALQKSLEQPLARLAAECAKQWGNRDKLDGVLTDYFEKIPKCTFLYTLDTQGIQNSDNVSHTGLLPEHFGRDRSQRPYMNEAVPASGFLLSEAYISLRVSRPSLTALQLVRDETSGKALGFVGADFDLRNLPFTAELYEEPAQWQQIKGDVAIRGTLFQQERVDSLLDQDIDQAISILTELITVRGMFQGVFHFSSSRATIWLIDDPFRYRLLSHSELSDPDICFAYPVRKYPEDALIPPKSIRPILTYLKELRFADDVIYLRSASINIFNGLISLTFSCDGSHYMPYQEFLDKNLGFWLGSTG